MHTNMEAEASQSQDCVRDEVPRDLSVKMLPVSCSLVFIVSISSHFNSLSFGLVLEVSLLPNIANLSNFVHQRLGSVRCFYLKSTYHGFLKMTVHVVWNIALRE